MAKNKVKKCGFYDVMGFKSLNMCEGKYIKGTDGDILSWETVLQLHAHETKSTLLCVCSVFYLINRRSSPGTLHQGGKFFKVYSWRSTEAF